MAVNRTSHRVSPTTLVALTAAFGLLAGGIAWGAIPHSTTGVIHGCYDKQGSDFGEIRVIDTQKSPPMRCRSGELAISWNQQGVQGPPGPPGQNGQDGAAGTDGEDGQSPVEIATWTVSFQANGSSLLDIGAATPFAEGDSVKSLSATLTGDFSACDDVGEVIVRLRGATGSGFIAAWTHQPGENLVGATPTNYLGQTEVKGDVLPGRGLAVSADCSTVGASAVPLPSFEMTITFEWTHAPPQTTYT